MLLRRALILLTLSLVATEGAIAQSPTERAGPNGIARGEQSAQAQEVVPMIHVPDVRSTIEWYVSIGFTVLNTFADDAVTNWALLSYGQSEIMLNAGGRLSTTDRRDVDLYIRTTDVDRLYDALKHRVEVRQGCENTFYGTREFAT